MDTSRSDAFVRRVAGILALVGLAVTAVTPPAAQASSAPLLHAAAAAGLSAAELSHVAGPIATEDRFGFSVAVSGDTLVVGAPEHDMMREQAPMQCAGAAYVFVRNGGTWSQQARLSAPDGAPYDWFGWSVAIWNDTIVVGTRHHNDAGAAYVFVRSGDAWSQQAELTAEDGAAFLFGDCVAIWGDTIVAGASRIVDDRIGAGAAYVFVCGGDTWSQQAMLTATDGVALDDFGWDVAISGDTIVVGAPQHDRDGASFLDYDQGAAYVFMRSGDTWSQQAELTAADAAARDRFGWSVDISGDAIVVGAPGHEVAYVFVPDGVAWSQETELSGGGDSVDRFGWCVAISGDTAVVGGAPFDSEDLGAAYVFVRRGAAWSQQAGLATADGAAGGNFGSSAAISGHIVAVGAPAQVSQVGTAYVFVRSGATWSLQGRALRATDETDRDESIVPVTYSGLTFAGGSPHRTVGGHDNAGVVGLSVFLAYGTTYPPEELELTADDGGAGDYFGWSVAMSGDTMVVGAPGRNGYTGAAYVFVGSGTTWSQQAKLTAGDGVPGDYFGWSVAISGDTITVGTRWRNSRGATYTFVRSGTAWSLWSKVFRTADGSSSDGTGYSVTVSGPRADVAAVIYGGWEGTPVKAYVGGTEQPTLYTAHDAFGRQAVLWTFYPPQSTDWTVRVEPQLPPGLASPRWQFRLVWVELAGTGFEPGQSAGSAVTAGSCSAAVLHFQLVDTGAQ